MAGGGGNTILGYIADGLALMFDAENNAGLGMHSSDGSEWKDLSVNGCDAYVPTGKSAPVVNGNNIYFGSGNAYKIDLSSDLLAHNQRDTTIEVVSKCKNYVNNKNAMLFGFGPWISTRDWGAAMSLRKYMTGNQTNDYTGAWYRESQTYANNNIYSSYMALNTMTVSSWTVDSNLQQRVYGYGRLTRDEFVFPVTLQNFTFGYIGNSASNTDAPAYSEIYQIRFYSRALIADEIAANYAVDKARFNLPDAT